MAIRLKRIQDKPVLKKLHAEPQPTMRITFYSPSLDRFTFLQATLADPGKYPHQN
jgi:hypothetical protein